MAINTVKYRALTAVAVGSTLLFFLVRFLDPSPYHIFSADQYLWQHTTLEVFAVFVAYTVFSITWYRTVKYNQLRPFLIGIMFLAVGLIDFFHALSYEGMPEFLTPSSTAKATYFWVAGRLVKSLLLLGASFVGYRHVSMAERIAWLAGSLSLALACLLVIAYGAHHLPVLFVNGVGLTPLKIMLEYLIMAIMAVSAIRYGRQWVCRRDELSYYFLAALILSILSELSFTLYTDVFDSYNLLGHIYKVGAYLFIYHGLFALAVKKPYEDLSEAFVKLQQKQRLSLLGEISAKLSHEMKNSLAAIKGCAQIGSLKIGDQDRDAADLFKRIERAADELGQLTQEASQMASSSQTAKVKIEEVDMKNLVERVCSFWSMQLKDKNTSLTCHCPPSIPHISGSSRLLRQAIINLLANAAQALEEVESGEIRLSVEPHPYDHSVLLTVADNGPGIPEEVQPKLFENFFTTKLEGTGQGLVIVKEIIENVHGGKIWFESAPDRGTKFFISLPVSISAKLA